MDVATMMAEFVSYGFDTDDEMTDLFKIACLNETYWDACAREDWPFLFKSTVLTFDGTNPYASNDPGDIGQVMMLQRATDGMVLQPWRQDDFYEAYGSVLTDTESPMLYYFEGEQLRFYPIPTTGDSALIKYVQVPAELSATSLETDILFPKRYHRSVLVMGTLSRLAVAQDDLDMGAGYERLYEKALAFMVDDILRQQSQRTDYIHVNDPDNWDYSA